MTKNDLVSREVVRRIIDSPRSKEQMLAMLASVPSERLERIGKWHKLTGMMPPEYAGVYVCSLCDGMAMRDWKHHRQTLTKYCPNCGARMDNNE